MDSGHFTYIDNNKALTELINSFKDVDRLAIDTEADSLHSYYEKTCLIQLSFNEENFLIDPLADVDIKSFLEELNSKELILHGGDYDLRMMRQSYGFEFEGRVFDTMLAAQLLGYERLGLAALLEKHFDIKLNKSVQRSDWSRRPLSKEQLHYATYDTYYLENLAEKLEQELRDANRLGWFREHCQHMVNSTTIDKEVNREEAWRVKGYNDLHPAQLRYLRAIWHWREKIAQQLDVPPFKVMRSETMMRMAKWKNYHPGQGAEEFKGLPRNFNFDYIHTLNENLFEADALAKSQWPEKRKKRNNGTYTPENRHLVDKLKDACAKVADANGLPLPVIISRHKLSQISTKLPTSVEELSEATKMQKWQVELLADTIFKVIKNYKKK